MSMLEGWSAWYNEAPGDDPTMLFVAGEIEFAKEGGLALLDLGDEGPADDPTLTALRLTILEPGDDAPTGSHIEPVTWQDIVPGQSTVRIDTPEGPVTVEVQHLS